MADISIRGGKPLRGSVSIQGSKNAALPMMAASLLHRGVSVLLGCPRIADVFCMEELLRQLGAVTWWEGQDLYMDCTHAEGTEISRDSTSRMRSSVILLGVLLARGKKGRLGYPGGCVIGKRPVDYHLNVLKSLGARICEDGEGITATCGRLMGSSIYIARRSVGATEQAVLSAATAKGETVLQNCAREPEIVWLCRYLRGMGARIEGEGGDCIRIFGVKELGPGTLRVPPDRIVAGTYMCAAAITRGKIALTGAPEEELQAFLSVYGKIGGQYYRKSGKLIVDGSGIDFPIPFLETEVYPGFPTDLQSPLMAVLATVPGRSRIREQIFEQRYMAAQELNRMGAQIRIDGADAVIEGGFPLHGCPVRAQELRGGAALILAALAAEGETLLDGYHFVRRGYAHICSDLCALGADITNDTGTKIYERIQLSKENRNQ